MKKVCFIIFAMLLFSTYMACPNCNISYADEDKTKTSSLFSEPMMAIIIDDFGGYERNGVEEIVNIPAPLTCAVIPFADNTKTDAELASSKGHEVILHMPMESHVKLPDEWYGATYIKNNDDPETVRKKLDDCLAQVPMAKGVNIHIGSGVCRNKELMTTIISHLKSKNKYFCDSRTHIETVGEQASIACGQPYLARDVFLEPHGMGGYANACKFLIDGAKIAKEKGYSIAIGHVGREGGVSTAKAIADSLDEISKMGVKIVPLSKIYEVLEGTHV